MAHPFLTLLSTWLLGRDPRQRRHLVRFLISASVYAFSLAAQWTVITWDGFVWVDAVPIYIALVAGVIVGFYALLRSTLSRGLADPALTVPQMAFAILALAGAYLINPPVRGMLLMIVALVLVYGAFALAPRQCRQLGAFSVLALGAAMATGAWLDPERFPPRIEALHFLFSLVVLTSLGLLAGLLSQLRVDLRAQKLELRGALDRIHRLATRDDLTGLPNRRHAQELLAEAASLSTPPRLPLSLGLLDIDHFKRINDTLGHAAGDEVLRRVAQEAALALRDTDVLARWGGEEFLLLMPKTPLADAQRALERVRQHLDTPEVWQAQPELRVTFSAGLTVHRDGETMQDTIARADSLLYRAKDDGRNRVAVSEG